MTNKILLLLCFLILTACSGSESNIDININVLTKYKWYANFENIDISSFYYSNSLGRRAYFPRTKRPTR